MELQEVHLNANEKTTVANQQHVNKNLASVEEADNGDRTGKMKESVKLSTQAVFFNGATHLLLFAIACFITFKSFGNGIALFSWHPSMMAIGYLVLMTHAVLSMSDNNLFTNKLEYKSRVYAHWVLQALSGVLITVAFTCIYANKWRADKPHFQTTHSLVGLTTVCLTLAAIVGGVFTKYSFRLRTIVRPVYMKIGHAALGSVTYMLAVASVILGIYSKWFEGASTPELQGVFAGVLCLTTAYVLIKPMLVMATRFRGVMTRENL